MFVASLGDVPGTTAAARFIASARTQRLMVRSRSERAALVGAGAATLAEAVSPHSTDNLSVPLVAAGVAGVVMQGFY